MTAVKSDLERIVRREHSDPHHVLGAHPGLRPFEVKTVLYWLSRPRG